MVGGLQLRLDLAPLRIALDWQLPGGSEEIVELWPAPDPQALARMAARAAPGLAAQAACIHLLASGDHVVLSDDVYGGTYRQFDKVFKQFGITYTRANLTDLNAAEAAFKSNTKMVWLETPTNPLLKVIDIAAVARLAKSKGALTVVDNTFATPVLTNPLALGADVVSHSCTKYIGGHSDVIGGALICRDDELANRLRFTQNAVGAIAAPWDSFLLLRSTKTLHVRVHRHCENAAKIADFLAEQRQIERVVYPGRTDHPQHTHCQRQPLADHRTAGVEGGNLRAAGAVVAVAVAGAVVVAGVAVGVAAVGVVVVEGAA